MTYEEEEAFLSQFINEADGGHITDVKAIKAAYDERVGHKTGHGQICFVLHRHGWSKKLPRSRHPKSADPEAVCARCGRPFSRVQFRRPFSRPQKFMKKTYFKNVRR